MVNVVSMYDTFSGISYEDDHKSTIPFAKAKSDIMIVFGLDDQIGPVDRVVRI